jgi:hypothetical protein
MINNSKPSLTCQFSMKDAFKFNDFTNDELWVLLRWVEMGKPVNQQRSGQFFFVVLSFFKCKKNCIFQKK